MWKWKSSRPGTFSLALRHMRLTVLGDSMAPSGRRHTKDRYLSFSGVASVLGSM